MDQAIIRIENADNLVLTAEANYVGEQRRYCLVMRAKTCMFYGIPGERNTILVNHSYGRVINQSFPGTIENVLQLLWDLPVINVQEAKYIPSRAQLVEGSTIVASHTILRSVNISLTQVLSYLVLQPGFAVYYDAYIRSPDPGVLEITQQMFEGILDVGLPARGDAQLTNARLKFIIHMIILSIQKPYVDENAAREFIVRRAAVFSATVETPAITRDNCTEITPPATLMGIRNLFIGFEKLKSAVFAYAIAMEGSEGTLIRNLLAASQMSGYTFIQAYVNAGTKNMSHIHPTIIRELDLFFGAVLRAEEEVGDTNVPFYKLLRPKSDLFNNANWKSLYHAAFVHAYVLNNNSMRNMVPPRGSEIAGSLAGLMSRELPMMYHQIYVENEFARRQVAMLNRLGLNANLIIDNIAEMAQIVPDQARYDLVAAIVERRNN